MNKGDLAERRWSSQQRQEGYTADNLSMEYWVRNGLAEIPEQFSAAIYRNHGGDIDKDLQTGDTLTGLRAINGHEKTSIERYGSGSARLPLNIQCVLPR